MDLISALKSELFRPLVTLVVPGAIAVAPYVLVVQARFAQVGPFWTEHPATFVAIVLTAVIAAGLVLENVGARIEELWDSRLRKKNSRFDEEWHEYLQLTTRDEILGQRYLRTLVTRMKFELSAVPALIVHGAGLWWANYWLGFLKIGEIVGGSLFLLGATAYLGWESFDGARTLGRLRQDIIASARKGERPA